MFDKIHYVWGRGVPLLYPETLSNETVFMKDWEIFEHRVVSEFDNAGHYAERTPGSGNQRRNDSDVHTNHFQLECKLKNAVGFTVTKEAWKKIVYRAGMRAKVPILVTGKIDELDEAVIVMRLRDFAGVLKQEDEL